MNEVRNDFIINVFTSPDPVEDEYEKIVSLLEAGVDFIHLRKPGMSKDEVASLIGKFSPEQRKRLRLHDHFDLYCSLQAGGVHLNGRNPVAPEGCRQVSLSAHSLNDIDEAFKSGHRFDYLTLSPIFDSISKSGYLSSFDPEEIAPAIRGKKIVALGGVTPDNFLFLKSVGFYGCALLGYIWNGPFESRLSSLREGIGRLRADNGIETA